MFVSILYQYVLKMDIETTIVAKISLNLIPNIES